MKGPSLFLVTDAAYDEDRILGVVDAVARAVPQGRFGVQLRHKARDGRPRAAFALRLREKTRLLGVPLVVNGDAALAHSVGADGVHLGSEAHAREGAVQAARSMVGHETWISVAAHGDADVDRALSSGVNAVLVSPIFRTPGKGPPRGVVALASARAIAGMRLLVFALGGVDAEGAHSCRDAGADGVAVIRALLSSPDPAAQARRILAALDVPRAARTL